MPRSIAVVDDIGNVYEPTYPKRARGLVKHGRARWLDENSICLSCPPRKKTEEHEMSNVMPSLLSGQSSAEEASVRDFPSVRELMDAVSAITRESKYLEQAIEMLRHMPNGDSGECGAPGNIADKARAEAAGQIVHEREATNRQVLAFYSMIYNDLMTQRGLRGAQANTTTTE